MRQAPQVRTLRVPSLPRLAVPAIGIGTFGFSLPSAPDREASIDLLRYAFDSGITLVNSAHAYAPQSSQMGHNEQIVGDAVRGWRGGREQVIVTTKIGIVREGPEALRRGDRESLLRLAEASASALGFVPDVTSCHRVDCARPFSETVKGLLAVEDAGLTAHIGISNVTLDQFETAWRVSEGRISVVENEWSPRNREAAGVMSRCVELGVLFLAWSPLGGSAQAARLDALHPSFRSVSEQLGSTPQQVALAWAMSKTGDGPGAVVPIPGCGSRASVDRSAGATELHLESRHEEALDLSPAPNDSAFPDLYQVHRPSRAASARGEASR